MRDSTVRILGEMAKKPAADSLSDRRLTETDFKRIGWRCVGPASMGGRVADMCFQPGRTKTYYVAYATGGIWRTTNLGTTFEPIFDDQVTSCIGSIACCDAPDQGDEGKGAILWVGTGEGNGRNSSSWGNGVYRSTDKGKTWTHLGLEDSHDIPRIAVDPRNPDVCYVAALGHLWGHNEQRGLYKTTDAGKTWDKVLGIDDKTGCCEVILDPKNPDTVYCAMYMRLRKAWTFVSGGPEGGIYKSTDGGKNWTKLAGGLPEQTGRIGLDIYAKDPNKLIAVVESTQEGANSIRDDRQRGGGVFRSNDGGQTWERMSVRSPRAFYFSKIKFDPNDDQRVYMLGWTTEVSIDGGRTFFGGVADILHADHHAILINPDDSDHVIIGTDGGVYQSFDKAKTWDFLNTMATGQFYNLGLSHEEPYRIIGGLQDNGTWVGPSRTVRREKKDERRGIPDTSITNADWTDCFWGDGFHCAFDPTDSDVIYAEWQGGHITRVNLRTGEKKYCSPEAREGQPRHRYNWNTPFFVSKHDPTVLYHAGNMVFKLLDRGDRWQRISDDLTTADPAKMETVGSNAETYCSIVSLAESPLHAGEIWAGSDDGLIHVTRNDGKSWANVTPPTTEGRYISRVHPSAHKSGRCYASIDGHRTDDFRACIVVTEDFGKNWTDITANLPHGRTVKVVREDLFNPEVLYAGTESGLWISADRGQNWVKMHGKSLPTVPVDDIQQHPRLGDLVLGTHGRSIYILDCARFLSELTPENLGKSVHLCQALPGRPMPEMEVSGAWTHKIFRAPNPPAGVVFDYWVKEYTGEDIAITIKNDQGTVMKKLSGGGHPGLNRVNWDLQPDEWLKLGDQGEEPWIQPFYARPGKYTASLKMGEHECSVEFEVLGLA